MAGPREGQRGEERTVKDRGEAGCVGVLGRIQVTHRCADDPVRRHVGGGGFGVGGGCPPPEGYQEAGREGGVGQVRST